MSAIGARVYLPDRAELLGEGRQHLGAIISDAEPVLDTNAAEPFQLDARLDRDDVSGYEPRFAGRGAEYRRLVQLNADTVSEPVPEVAGEFARLDQIAGGC